MAPWVFALISVAEQISINRIDSSDKELFRQKMNILEQFSLRNKVSIITGGERGLGKAMAQSLAQAGSDIVIADLDLETAKQTADWLASEGGRTLAVRVDVTDPTDVDKMTDEILRKLGRIDVLFNNAGISQWVNIEEMSLEDWRRIMSVNLDGVFIVSKAVGKIMIKQGQGSIVNTSSMSGVIVNSPQSQAAYNVSKAAVIMLTKSLAFEWAKHNIRVNTIAPGYMETEMVGQFRMQHQDKMDLWTSLTPMKRMGKPHELGALAVYLASDASSYMTGAVCLIDGGYSIL
jgi:NAD(P)-dependent dehydrogenase (short-subunit alcohol dehydrogenase family)